MNNNLRMKWKSRKSGDSLLSFPGEAETGKKVKLSPVFPVSPISDEKLALLGQRFQANNICFLLDITFESYLLAPAGWDRIAKHLNGGGGCRVLEGMLVINEPHEGICAWCERWWSKRSGGLNKTDLCPECARNMQKSRDSLLSSPAQPETGKSKTVPAFLEVNHA